MCGHPTPSLTPWDLDILYIWSISSSVFVTINKHTQAPRTSKRDQCYVYPPAELMRLTGQKNIREERILDASQNNETWRFQHNRVRAKRSAYSRLSFHQNAGQPRSLAWDREKRDWEKSRRLLLGTHTAQVQAAFDQRKREGDATFRMGSRAPERVMVAGPQAPPHGPEVWLPSLTVGRDFIPGY